jgi:hypothetical protein
MKIWAQKEENTKFFNIMNSTFQQSEDTFNKFFTWQTYEVLAQNIQQ